VGYSEKHHVLDLKRHVIVEAHLHPLNFTLSRANRNDQINILETVDGIRVGQRVRRPKRLGLDKGYDSEPLRRALRQRQIIPIAPYRNNHVSIPKGQPPKTDTINAIVGNGGKWNTPSLGSTTRVAWIGLSNMDRKLIGL
jgi:hypothetical protein